MKDPRFIATPEGRLVIDMEALTAIQHRGMGAARYHGYEQYRLIVDGCPIDCQMLPSDAEWLEKVIFGG